MTATPAMNVMTRLKQATAALHADVEALPRMRRLVDPELTREEYQDLLRRFYRANRICEHHLRQHAAVWESRGLDWSTRLGKTNWLEEDLRRLDPGWRPSAPDAHLVMTPVVTATSLDGPSLRPSPSPGNATKASVSPPCAPAEPMAGTAGVRTPTAAPAEPDAEPASEPYSGEGFARAAGCFYVLEGATLGSRVILGLLGRARERPAGDATRFFQGYGPQTGERWATLGRDLQAHLGQDEKAFNQALVAASETYAFLGSILGGR